VEFVERLVAHEMTPPHPPMPPARFVDQNRHAVETGTLGP
jgi:hypothetical protein